MINRRGSVVTRYRATRTRTAGGSSNQSWASQATTEKFLLETPRTEVVQRLFGQDVRCDLFAFVKKDVPLAEKDGITITAGWRVGESYEVERIADFDQGRAHAHYEVALVRRPGGFS
jgi:hypothetical protein